MLVTVVNRRDGGYAGSYTLPSGTVLTFASGQAGPVDISYADVASLAESGGFSVTTSDNPPPAYDPDLDAEMTAVQSAATSQFAQGQRAALGAHRTREIIAQISGTPGAANQTITGYTDTQVNLPTVVRARGLQPVTNGIKIPPGMDGMYTAGWSVRVAGTDSAIRDSLLRINGTSVSEIGFVGISGRHNGTMSGLDLKAGDVVDLIVYFEGTAAVQTAGTQDTQLTVVRKNPIPVQPITVGNTGDTIPSAPQKMTGEWFSPRSQWSDLTSTTSLQSTALTSFVAAYPEAAADIAVPLIPHDQPATNWNSLLDEVVAGTHDAAYTTMGQNLAKYGPKTVYARPWWEFNIGYDSNGGYPDFTKFQNAWTHAIPLIRSGFSGAARSGQTLSIVYCAAGDKGHLADYWPGDSYVDVVSADMYAMIWGSTEPDAATLTSTMNQRLTAISNFAATHSKPVALSEWANVAVQAGTTTSQGRGDFPDYIDTVFDWADSVQALYLCFYNIVSGPAENLGTEPLSLARYQARAPLAVSALTS